MSTSRPPQRAALGHPPQLSRRSWLRAGTVSLGMLALGDLLRADSAGQSPSGGTHFPARARRVIFLFMQGGPSQVDTFDFKPELPRLADQGLNRRVGGQRMGGRLLPSPWQFHPAGESGTPISELLPRIARHADKLCVVNSMQTTNPAHPQATLMLHTGSTNMARPSLGSWVIHGLGTANENLPSFVTINPVEDLGGARNYGSAFLPGTCEGTRVAVGPRPIPNLSNGRVQPAEQREQLAAIRVMNESLLDAHDGDGELQGLLESYELAFRMQGEAPDRLDIDQEPQSVRDRYGVGSQPTDNFARQCLMARRLAEAGVRFIEVTHRGWDQHAQLKERLTANCRAIDQPIAALLEDLEQRGLLRDTLVIWGGEFGRTPVDQGNGNGRRHNASGFTMWLAGGGIRGGLRYGATDASGYDAVENPVSIHDLHATILHQLGFDHTRLTFPYSGRDFRLTDVHGQVVRGILS